MRSDQEGALRQPVCAFCRGKCGKRSSASERTLSAGAPSRGSTADARCFDRALPTTPLRCCIRTRELCVQREEGFCARSSRMESALRTLLQDPGCGMDETPAFPCRFGSPLVRIARSNDVYGHSKRTARLRTPAGSHRGTSVVPAARRSPQGFRVRVADHLLAALLCHLGARSAVSYTTVAGSRNFGRGQRVEVGHHAAWSRADGNTPLGEGRPEDWARVAPSSCRPHGGDMRAARSRL